MVAFVSTVCIFSMTLITHTYLSNMACPNRVVLWANTVCVHWTGHDAPVSALINNVATPPIVTSWIYINCLTFFIQPRPRKFQFQISQWMIYVMIQLAINCSVSYFLDLMSRSWSAFVECDRPIRITGSYLSRSRADRFWNRAQEFIPFLDVYYTLCVNKEPGLLTQTLRELCLSMVSMKNSNHWATVRYNSYIKFNPRSRGFVFDFKSKWYMITKYIKSKPETHMMHFHPI